MIETSKDLLFVVLALCILWLTIFLTWFLYYVIAIVRDAKKIVAFLKDAAFKIDKLARNLHDKLDRSAATFTLAAKAMKEIVGWAIEQRSDYGPPKKRKRTTKKK
jgi:hypothetical protein